ncbi:MAG: hypothetical protein CMG41_06585 [Candidatus Marinimicrobia bacterium]|nr:hypothetical protein [Candidatus Neomarinimicrobiota bacterium]
MFKIDFFMLIFKKILLVQVFLSICFSQWFNLNHEGVDRPYFVRYPDNASEPRPLIINMHGFTNSVSYQIEISEMNDYVNEKNVAVVYPQGISDIGVYSWNVGVAWDFNTSDDIGFINTLIDQVSEDFAIDTNRVYACGYSNGGFMTYELACELSDRITAFGAVAGNFMLNADQQCSELRDIPIIHIHGVNDATVSYYGPSIDGSFTTPETIEYWKDRNSLDQEDSQFLNTNVEVITYSKENSDTKVTHYKVLNGDHEWVDDDWGFHTSEVLIDFFLEYELTDFIESDEIILIGDINNDGNITLSDAFIIISLINNEMQIINSDLNFDGLTNIFDLLIIINNITNS